MLGQTKSSEVADKTAFSHKTWQHSQAVLHSPYLFQSSMGCSCRLNEVTNISSEHFFQFKVSE